MTSSSGDEPPRRGLLVSLLVTTLGVALGAAAGLAIYPVATHASPGSALDLTVGSRPFWYALGGAIVGLLVSYWILGVRWIRNLASVALGTYVGTLAGILVYLVGVLLLQPPADSSSHAFLQAVAAVLWPPTGGVLFAALVGAALGLLVSRYVWRFEGLLAFVSLAAIVVGYITYGLVVSLPQVAPSNLPLSIVLFVAESGTLLLVLVYAFYPMDLMGRRNWERDPSRRPFDGKLQPKVAFHVPVFNEPPDMVIATLRSLLEVDYPRDKLVILVLDDSTDEEARIPVRDFCERTGIGYIHREDRTGYKAGALNVGLDHTPEDVELIGVVDADYQVRPGFLRSTVGYFVDEDLAFLQTPQNYRNKDASFLTEQYYYADQYFYQTVLPSRNEANAIIFCGTMGILRRSVLEEVGRWSEDHVTEDAELASRILAAGYESLYLDEPFGDGLIPETFEGYRKQHHRWAFGGGQILRTHLLTYLGPRFSLRQTFDYIAGIIHWFDGVLLFIIAMTLLAMATGDLAGFDIVTHHQHEVWLVGLVPIFLLVEAITRVQLSLRRHFDLGFGGTLRVLGMWFAVKFSNTAAAWEGFLGFKMGFKRTPKHGMEGSSPGKAITRAIRSTPFESAMGIILLVVGILFTVKNFYALETGRAADVTRFFLTLWLGLYAAAFLAAPLYAYRSYTGEPPVSSTRSERRETPGLELPGGTALVAFLAILALALGLRLLDPLSTPVIGAEDPYVHMTQAWDLVQLGKLPAHYPPGFIYLIAPLTYLGSQGFYLAARFLPVLSGVVEVAGLYFLSRASLGEEGALTVATVAAIMPENIRRTNLLFPTALDLALLPWLLLLVLRAESGDRKSILPALLLVAILFVAHPWVIGLLLPPLFVYLWFSRRVSATVLVAALAVAVGAVVAGTLVYPHFFDPAHNLLQHAGETAGAILQNPATLQNLPRFVDLPKMLTIPVLLLATAGAVLAAMRRNRVDLLALVWTGLMMPLVLVDWFHIWYLPHRTVVYMSLGIALLAGVAVDGLLALLPRSASVRRPAFGAIAVSIVLITAPTAAGLAGGQGWYRLFNPTDYSTWHQVAARNPSIVVTGSWQNYDGYRAITGKQAQFSVAFFNDSSYRQQFVAQHPGMLVLVDHHATQSGVQTDFLASWTLVLKNGDDRVYAPPNQGG